MQYIDVVDHLTESKNRRMTNMEEQIGSLFKPGEPEPYPEYRMNDTTPIYLSHTYYKTKWNTIDSDTHALASAQNGYMPNKEDGTCQAPEATENDIDLSKERIMSNRVKMGLAEMGTKEEQKNLRQSALMSYAFGWQPSCELPIDRMERNENEQIIESIFSKMAKVHHFDNYNKMVEIFSSQEMSGNRLSFSRSFYTVDHGQNHPVTKLGGILEGIQAKDISTLSKSKSPRAATFFGQKVEIQPNFINFNMIKILIAEQIKFTIENIDTDEDIVINNMMTSSPEILIYPPKGKNFPITLKSGQKMTFTCLISPETWGLIQGAVIVSFDAEFMFMIPLTAFSASNDYNLDPVFYTNVNVGETVSGMLKLKNPSNSEELEILEIYSNDDQLKLYWPNQVQVASATEAQSNRDFSKYLKIEAGAKGKTVLHYKFETDQILDHRSLIHILTNRGEIIRIPFYFHVYPDLVKFTPSVIDFGIVPFRFDLLRIPVTASFRNGYEFGVLYLTQVLLPIHDKRLDFVMGSWDRENFGNIQVLNKNSRRLEEHRRGVLQKDKQLNLFTVVMNPIAYGPIDTEIILVFQSEDGQEHRVDLPIIGHVLPQSNLMTEFGNKQMNSFQPWTIAKPAITIDVSNYLNEASTNPQQALLKNKRTEERLILANTLGKQMKGFELVSTFTQDQTFVYMSGSSSKQGDTSRSASIAPGQTLQLGVFVLNLKDFKTTAGRFYFFVHVNGNLFFPMAIQVTENRLVCSYQPDDYTIPHYKDCQSGLDLKLGNMVPYQAKCRPVNMTNIGAEPVQIDWLIRSSPELSVRINSVHPQPGSNFPHRTLGDLNLEDLKTRVGIWIYPQQTIIFDFCSEANQRSLFGASELISTHVFKLQFLPRTYTEMTINLSMKLFDGVISFTPKKTQLQFSPAFFGQDKHESQSIYFKSSLKKNVLVKSVSIDDARFKIQVLDSQLKNQTEVVKVTFDPNAKPQPSSVAVGIKNPQDVSKILQRVTNQEGSAQNTQQVPANFELQPLVIQDFTRYRSVQEYLFKERKKYESLPVSANLVIETDFLAPITYKIKAEIVPAQIIMQPHIDFGRVHIGSSISHPLLLKNPFTDPLKVQIYIGRTTLQTENELKRLKLQAITQEYDEDQDQTKIKQKFAEKLLHQLNYTEFYCFRVLTISKDNKFLAESTPPMTRKWNVEDEWSNYYDDSVYLNRESEKDTVCNGILRTLSKYESKEDFEKDLSLWHKVDGFFRELLISNINLQTNLNLDSLSYEQLNHMGVIQQIEALIDQLVQSNESQIIESQLQQKSVDQIIFDDTLECSKVGPLLDVKQNQWSELTQQIAFPNYFDFYFPVRPYLKHGLSKLTLPFTWTSQILRNASKQETWIDYGHSIFSDFISTGYEVFSESLSPKKARPLRPEDFLVQRARDRNFFPAATITAQYQLLNEELHKDIVRNNGTIGIERSVQNFFINQKYSKMFIIPPLSNVSLSDAIIFEPHVLTTIDKPLEMSLYVKTDKQFMMKVDLTGQAVSSVLELTDIAKLGIDEKQEKVFKHQRATDIPVFCNQQNQNRDRQQANCLNEQDQSELINQQVFGRSTLTPLINLKVEFSDVLPSDPESIQKLPQISIFQRLFNFVNRQEVKDEQKNITLASQVDWLLTFANIGNDAFKVTKVGFEDQITGEITCQQGEVAIEPCGEISIAKLSSQTFHLYLKTDYSTSAYKKTLAFVSQGHIQRFPIHINTEMSLLEYAHQTHKSDYVNYLCVTVCVICCILTVGDYIKDSLTNRFKKQSAVQSSAPPAINIQSIALPLYQQVQDRFRMHNAQFMREATNLGKRSNSALMDYQKQITSLRKPAAQVTVNRIRLRPQNQSNDPENKEQEYKDDESKVQDESQVTLLQEDQKPQKLHDIIQSPLNEAETAAPPVVQEKSHVNKEPVIRMNKKERRAYEQRKREIETATETIVEQSTAQPQKEFLQTSQKAQKSDLNNFEQTQELSVKENEYDAPEIQVPGVRKTEQSKITQNLEESKKNQGCLIDKKSQPTDSDSISTAIPKTIRSKELQTRRNNQLAAERETRLQKEQERTTELLTIDKTQPPIVDITEEQIKEQKPAVEELQKSNTEQKSEEKASELVAKVQEVETQQEIETNVSEPVQREIETVPMSNVQSEYKKVEEYKQTVRNETYVFRPKRTDEIIQVEPPKYKRVVDQTQQPKVQEEINQPAQIETNTQKGKSNVSQTTWQSSIAQPQKNIYQQKQNQDEPDTTNNQQKQTLSFEPSQSFQIYDQGTGYSKKPNLVEPYIKAQKQQQPVKPQQVSQQVYQQQAKPQSTRTVTDTRQETYYDRNQGNQAYYQKQKEHQSDKYTYQHETNYDRKAPQQSTQYKYNYYQERPRRDIDQFGYDQEVSDYDSQSHKFPTSYAYQRNKTQQEWEPAYDQEDEYEQEYNEEYDSQVPMGQYQQYQKRPQWQQNQETSMSQTQRQPSYNNQKPYISKLTQEKSNYQQKQKTYFGNEQQQPQIYQPKVNDQVSKFTQSQTTQSTQQPVVGYWKPKENKSKFEDKSSKLQTEQVENNTQIEPVEEVKQEPQKIVQEEQKANNFYNAFKSIQSIFSQKKVLVEDDEKDDTQSSDFKRPTSNFNNSGLSLFGNSLFARESTTQQQEHYQRPSYENLGQSRYFKTPEPESLNQMNQPQKELFKPQEVRMTETPILAFKPLREYNNVFSDSLDTLTNIRSQPKTDQSQNNSSGTPSKDSKDSQFNYKFF